MDAAQPAEGDVLLGQTLKTPLHGSFVVVLGNALAAAILAGDGLPAVLIIVRLLGGDDLAIQLSVLQEYRLLRLIIVGGTVLVDIRLDIIGNTG